MPAFQCGSVDGKGVEGVGSEVGSPWEIEEVLRVGGAGGAEAVGGGEVDEGRELGGDGSVGGEGEVSICAF